MMKAQNKNRKHPTCSRCRFHGKKDIRVLQHQCPFRNCTCSSCFLIKRRSIIYRAQKNLDKTEDNSNECESSGGSGDGCVPLPNNFDDINSKNGVNGSISRSSDSSSDATTFGNNCFPSETSINSVSIQSWKETGGTGQSGMSSNPTLPPHSVKSPDHYTISDFQSLCQTFPELTTSQLQSIFEQCGHDFQRTIDRVLMSKWCTDTDCKPNVQFNNNNDWWSASPDYASNNTIQPNRSPQTPSSMTSDGMASDFYNINNGQNAYDWRTNSGSGIATDDLCPNDYGNDYYYDQSYSSCAVMSTQGNNQTVGSNWNYDYNGYWYSNSQGSHTSNGSTGSYELNSGFQLDDPSNWSNGQIATSGPLALGPVPEHNI